MQALHVAVSVSNKQYLSSLMKALYISATSVTKQKRLQWRYAYTIIKE